MESYEKKEGEITWTDSAHNMEGSTENISSYLSFEDSFYLFFHFMETVFDMNSIL